MKPYYFGKIINSQRHNTKWSLSKVSRLFTYFCNICLYHDSQIPKTGPNKQNIQVKHTQQKNERTKQSKRI